MDDLTNIYLISILILLILSAIFAASETSVTAASRARTHRLASEGNKRAKKLEKLLRNKEDVISAMLIGNNAVNILASALATAVFIKLFGDTGLVYATIIMTIIVLIFSEIAPKTFALKIPDKMALFLTPLILFLVKIMAPFNIVSKKIVNSFIVVFFPKLDKKSLTVELEEIRDTVDLKHQEGSIFKHDKDLIDGVLDLANTEISEIMTHRREIESINIELPVSQIIEKALNMNYTRIPLWRKNKENIVAILNIRKLLKSLRFYKGNIEEFNLSSAISNPWFVPSTNSLRSQLVSFRKKKKRFSVVVDEYGSILGIITLEDILEEIVGEMREIGDESESEIIKIKTGLYKIEGRALIRDVNKKLDWSISEDDHAYNLAAFVINHLGRIPEKKEKVTIDGYFFEILDVDGNDLVSMKVRKEK